MSGRTLRIHSSAIHYFDMVRRCRSIREAARRLNVASSAVNRQILKIEDEIGAPLFERLPGGLRLTMAGEILSRHANLVLQDLERVRLEFDALRGLKSGHVEIATAEGATVDLLPSVLKRMRDHYPQVTIGVTVQGSQSIPQALINSRADLGLAFAVPRAAEIRQLSVGHFRLGALVSPDHPLAERGSVNFATCAEHGLILAKSELSIHHLLAPLHKRLGLLDKPPLQSNSMELARQMARHNMGVAFQTRVGVEADLQKGELLHIPLSDQGGIYSDLGLYARSGRDLPSAVEALAHLLSEEIALRERAERAFGQPVL
ncbi:DNA-binding transcriptional LysR family regulator [Pseudomonas protegens]|mgnify:CR=1 FL=1|jgi:DNA-binding transcriptional LysR family regulator|uniref:Transcriptional regulator, LysR family n=3 Tax=Gammaproteobacteria TaxID=1236 RepID=A0A2C9EJ81_PSEPH|nr:MULTISPECIES: LysR family transcriptional regulator [Pseudomonas]BCQ60616.1 transcriptional regulator [Pseudomonas sp. Boi14]GED78582.1 transcriptional regulator [Pseudomonas fluorescens]AGL83707.1 transcriptional regulator, LysR family [Pseudomonas protegens CHA0]APC20753.1 LysR family transcriptional regulator [Pseudomonas protegens]AQT08706.1 LysR family transcriptional regulator [Pseudomonas protegens]